MAGLQKLRHREFLQLQDCLVYFVLVSAAIWEQVYTEMTQFGTRQGMSADNAIECACHVARYMKVTYLRRWTSPSRPGCSVTRSLG